jgi:tetratricopeptide (TPR) repeat protein
MNKEQTTRQNRIRETLDRLYDQHPPHFREQLRRLQEDPTSRVFAPLAESYRRMGRVEEAIEMCQVGLEHHPDFHGGRVALAKCYLDKRRYQDAQQELERVVHLAPENLLAQRLLGEAFLAQGNKTQALHAFKMALLLAPCDIGLTDKIHQIEKQLDSSVPHSSFDQAPSQPLDEFVEVLSSPAFPEPEVVIEQKNVPDGLREWELNSLNQEPMNQFEEDSAEEEDEISLQVNAVLGFTEESEDVFTVGSVNSAFEEGAEFNQAEITTETLGDLYFSQGQFGHSLKIFEKIYRTKPTQELSQKIKACRMRLGVDKESVIRNKKIEVLKGLLEKVQHGSDTPQ